MTYTIVTSNAGPGAATNVTVTDVFPTGLSGCSTTCVAAGGATCTAGPVAGDLSDVVSLPAGASVTHTASCLVDPGFTGQLVNTASADPGGASDATLTDNDAVSTVAVSVFEIPTLSDATLALLALALAAFGWFASAPPRPAPQLKARSARPRAGTGLRRGRGTRVFAQGPPTAERVSRRSGEAGHWPAKASRRSASARR